MQGIPTYIGSDQARKPMAKKMTPREAVARIFPVHDRQMADRVMAWLDHCGYQIVDKAQVSVVPPVPADEDQQRTPEFLSSPT